MVEHYLTEALITAGAKLVHQLDASGLSPDAAFWLYSPEAQSWKLYLTEVKLSNQGPKAAYSQLQNILSRYSHDLPGLSLHDVVLETPEAPIIALLKKAIRTGRALSRIRFTNNVIDGTLIPDALIYRVT